MVEKSPNDDGLIAPWHRKLLAVAAAFTILLIGMGGVLSVTQSIRSCPDWPGCFGKLLPPLETSPILEITHRFLAGSSGLLILASAIAGLIRKPRLRWIMLPPLAAAILLVEVSYFGARVVLHGLSPGLAALDVGSALLVAALMLASAVIAQARQFQPDLPDRLSFRSPLPRTSLAVLIVVYAVLLSGVLVAGPNSISASLGWPVYSPHLFQLDSLGIGNVLRLALSVLGIFLFLNLMRQIWKGWLSHPELFRTARWVLAAFLLEALLQMLLLVFGFKIALLVPYTLIAAVFWGLLVTLAVKVGLTPA